MQRHTVWTLNKLIVLLVLGAFFMLLLEIRYAHRDVLGEHTLSWTPLVYSALMLVAGVASLLLWERGGRKVLFWCFAAGLVVGPLGLWLHTGKHPARGLKRELSAWAMPIHGGDEGKSGDEKQNAKKPDENKASGTQGSEMQGGKKRGGGAAMQRPPVLAPLAFFGLGLLGMLACVERFQPPAEEVREA